MDSTLFLSERKFSNLGLPSCVSTTAREAHQKGYDVLITEDAIGDRDIPGAKGDELTRTVLAELGDFFGTVIKSSDVQ